MNKNTSTLLACVQYLDKFYAQASVASTPEKSLLIADQLAIQLYKLWQQAPALVNALIALCPEQASAPTNLALKQASLLLRYSKQAKWPQWLIEQLLSAQLCSLIAIATRLQHYQNATSHNPQEFAQLTDPWKLCCQQLQPTLKKHLFLSLYQGCSRSLLKQAQWQDPAYASILTLCYQLALPTLPRVSQQAQGVETALKTLCQISLDPQTKAVVSALAADAQALTHVGRFCSDQIGEVALITSTVEKMRGHVIDMNSRKLVMQPIELLQHHYRLLAPRSAKDPDWFDVFSAEAESVNAAPPPSPISLAVLNQLNPMSSIGKQIQWFAQHPALVDFILQVASDYSRQQLPITELRHALALLGTDQLPSIVRQAWLAMQIQECRQPHQAWFTQWQKTFKTALLLLSEHSQVSICNAATAETISLSFSLQLQQDEHCRFLPIYRKGTRGSSSIRQRVQFLCWRDPEFPRQVSQTLASTGLASTWQDAVLHIRASATPSHRLATLCQLALLLTEQYFYGETDTDYALNTLWPTASKAIDLSAHSLTFWCHQIGERSQSYWPLYGDL